MADGKKENPLGGPPKAKMAMAGLKLIFNWFDRGLDNSKYQ